MSFDILETTIADIHTAYASRQLTCRQLVQTYLDRIETYDKRGPAINAIISVNPDALKEADRLDEAFKASGPVGALHGIPVIMGLYPHSRFYPAKRQFALWNTCNTWVAEALAAGGFPISPSFVITAGQLSEEISKIKQPSAISRGI